ncbi:MAG: SDR family oxidoreductase [Parasphingorhabdus sp.]
MTKAVISGSASGIGACIRTRLEQQGYSVTGIDIKDAEVITDLSTPEGRQAAIDGALEQTGGSIDILVLAAGLGGHLDDGQLVAKVNYYGAIELLDGFRDALASTKGRCVVISSNSAQMGIDPQSPIITGLLDGSETEAMDAIGALPAAATYGASKHAVARGVRRRAAEWGGLGIQLNAIAPGMTETPLFRGAAEHPTIGQAVTAIPIPQDRVASADEMAGIIEFMLSDAASYMHGSIIYVDGGTDAQLRPDAF